MILLAGRNRKRTPRMGLLHKISFLLPHSDKTCILLERTIEEIHDFAKASIEEEMYPKSLKRLPAYYAVNYAVNISAKDATHIREIWFWPPPYIAIQIDLYYYPPLKKV